MAAVPADHNVKDPLPKLEVFPSAKLLPPEIPAPDKPTWSVLALVSSVHPSVTEAAAEPGVAQLTVEST